MSGFLGGLLAGLVGAGVHWLTTRALVIPAKTDAKITAATGIDPDALLQAAQPVIQQAANTAANAAVNAVAAKLKP